MRGNRAGSGGGLLPYRTRKQEQPDAEEGADYRGRDQPDEGEGQQGATRRLDPDRRQAVDCGDYR
jgi:hypothetical protein